MEAIKGPNVSIVRYPGGNFVSNYHWLDVLVDCDTYDRGRFFLGLGETTTVQKNVPYLDVSAAFDKGEVTICVLNRNKDKAIATEIISQEGRFAGKFKVYEVDGPDIKAMNDFGQETVKTVLT